MAVHRPPHPVRRDAGQGRPPGGRARPSFPGPVSEPVVLAPLGRITGVPLTLTSVPTTFLGFEPRPGGPDGALEQFLNGVFSRLAQNRLSALRSSGAPAASASGSTGRCRRVSGSGFARLRAGLAAGPACGAAADPGLRPGDFGGAAWRWPLRGDGGGVSRVRVGDGSPVQKTVSPTIHGETWAFPQTDRHPETCVSWDDGGALGRARSAPTGRTRRACPDMVGGSGCRTAGRATAGRCVLRGGLSLQCYGARARGGGVHRAGAGSNPLRTGPALESMYRFVLWLVPAGAGRTFPFARGRRFRRVDRVDRNRGAGGGAQHWSLDARRIALGGVGGGNLASELVAERRGYRTLVLPFGLVQSLSDLGLYKSRPARPTPRRELRPHPGAPSPLHYTFGPLGENPRLSPTAK